MKHEVSRARPGPGAVGVRAISPFAVRIGLGLIATVLLLVATRLPLWQARFDAPQYPNGLRVTAYGNRVEGDLSEIQGLSHDIGLRSFNVADIPEMKLWFPVILVAIVAVGVTVVMRGGLLRRLACLAIWLIPVGVLADIQFRLWQMGHDLDPTAAIRVSLFTPHVIGPTSLENFTVWGIPQLALILIALAAALVTFAPWVARRLGRN